MTPILIGACDCAGPGVVAIAARERAARTIHRVAIGRLLRDGEGWQGEYPRPPVAQARRFADAGFAGIFFVETRGEGSAMRVQVQKWGNSLALRIPKPFAEETAMRERKSTRLNSSHVRISYAVFCLKKKKAFTTCTKANTTTANCSENNSS